MNIREVLKVRRLIMDGAMGTWYGQHYSVQGEAAEIANFTAPEQIETIHRAYIDAGADMIRTNTFASNFSALEAEARACGQTFSSAKALVVKNITAGFEIARAAVKASGKEVLIAADIGPIAENAATDESAVLEEYLLMAQTFLDSGADIILFETFADLKYILPVARFIKARSDCFVMTSFCLNKFGYTKSGISAAALIDAVQKENCIDSVGFNCGIGAAHMYHILKKLDLGDLIVSALPNSGYPDTLLDRSVYQENVDYFGERMKEIDALGIHILGGCCGTSPVYIQRLCSLLAGTAFDPAAHRWHTGQKIFGTGQKSEASAAVLSQNPLKKKLDAGEKVVLVELDPPYNADMDKIMSAAALLKTQLVDMITMADSPMGRTRANAMMVGARVCREMDIAVMPHISCRDLNQIAMGSCILGAYLNGIRNLLVVTGDAVQAGDRISVSSVFDFNSVTLMDYIKQMNAEYFADEPIVYGGALNHGRVNLDAEILRMQKKIAAGAAYFLTQPLYSQEDIDRIAYIKTKVDTKIIGGVMPLVSYRNAQFIKNEMTGIHVPDSVLNCYRPDMSREEGEAAGIACALELIEQMRDVVDGYYFIVPFHRAQMICRIIEQMRL